MVTFTALVKLTKIPLCTRNNVLKSLEGNTQCNDKEIILITYKSMAALFSIMYKPFGDYIYETFNLQLARNTPLRTIIGCISMSD